MAVAELLKARAFEAIGAGPIYRIRAVSRQLPAIADVWALERRLLSSLPRFAPADCVTVIPTLGRASLSTAVESALDQSLSDHRIVVVTDGPVGVPSLPANDQVSVVSLPVPVRSPGALRNIGMSLAASAFVAFLDDDNIWSKDHLSTCLDTLRSTGADVAYAACTRALAGGEVVDTIGRPWDHRAFRHENWIDVSSLVLARRFRYRWSRLPAKAGKGDDGTFGEDWSLVYAAGFRRRVVFTGKATVQYTMSPELATLVRSQRGITSTEQDKRLS